MKNLIQTVLLTGTVLTIAACGGKKDNQQQQAPPPTAVSIYTVKLGNATYYDQLPATVTALVQVDIQPQVSGNITGIFFQDGQQVRKGQKLYTIDPQQYRASYDQAVANLNVQKANLNRAQKDADRYNTLAQQDAVARQLVDNATATLETAKMQVEAARAAITQVATNLKYATIHAPLDGTIGISQVRLGAAVATGSVALNTISSNNPLAADIQIDQDEIARFEQLQRQSAAGRDSTFVLVLPGGSYYKYPGTIRLIDRAVDAQTGTLRVRIAFQNPDNALKAGLTANVRIKNNTGRSQLLIPYKAVQEQMSEYFVYVLGDSSKVVQKKVTLGPQINDLVIVQKGLKENEKIVTTGLQKIKDGAKVRVVPTRDSSASQNRTASAN